MVDILQTTSALFTFGTPDLVPSAAFHTPSEVHFEGKEVFHGVQKLLHPTVLGIQDSLGNTSFLLLHVCYFL